jgi:peptidoglycan/LPS O-acetylase OafA/YrhL
MLRSPIIQDQRAPLDQPQPMDRLPRNLENGLARREIPTLNGLRAIAVLLVVLYHAGLPISGGLGVLIFFTLSGFLITWLLLAEYRKTGQISLKNFYIRRSLRIFPAFYAYAALLIGFLLIMHKPINVHQTLASLFYVNNYYQAIHGDPNTGFSHTWSLAIEEQFYLLWAPSIIVLLRFRKVLPALIVAIVAVWVHRFSLIALGVHQGYIYEAFDTRADQLLVGCLLAWLLFDRKYPKFFQFICTTWMLMLLLSALFLFGLAEVRYGATFRDVFAFTFEPALVAMLIPALISAKDSTVHRVLESLPVAGIGRISYSMYLYQQLVIGPAHKLTQAQPILVQALAATAATIFAALCSYYVVEKPFLRLKARFL